MRRIHDHESCLPDDPSDSLHVYALDEPGAGGACHKYAVRLENENIGDTLAFAHFQEGPLQENAMNGCSNESLLAIVADRLKSFQAGPFSCRENAIALTNIQEAIMWLHQRTKNRMQRGVEGQTKA